MDPQQIMAKGREMLITELNIGHLSEASQNEVLDAVGNMLMHRVLFKLNSMLPENEQQNFGNLLGAGKEEEAQALVLKHIPNAEEVIANELRAGIEEHKRRVTEKFNQEQAAAAASTV